MLRKEPDNAATRRSHKESTAPIKHTKKPSQFLVPRQEAPGCPTQPLAGGFGFILGHAPKLYYRTNRVAARRIMRHGFKDSTNYYMEQQLHTGAWLSNVPLDFNQGASGEVLLQVETDLAESELAQYELITKNEKGYREWLVPAALINPRMTVSVVPE